MIEFHDINRHHFYAHSVMDTIDKQVVHHFSGMFAKLVIIGSVVRRALLTIADPVSVLTSLR